MKVHKSQRANRTMAKGAPLHLLRNLARFWTAVWLYVIFVLAPVASRAQSSPPDERTIPALLVSDIHFDLFQDPAKALQLAHVPVSQWNAILSAPPSSTQKQDIAALQKACPVRGVDTPYPLLRSSLQAMRRQQADAKFITVSGDLIAHSFDCKYAALVHNSTPAQYEDFVTRTIGYVAAELRDTFPGIPIYIAFGNNDTGCGDYQLDAGGSFLEHIAPIIAESLPSDEREHAAQELAAGGYYNAPLASLRNTRMIVINNLFLSPRYSTCAGKPDPAAADAQMKWLAQQLAQARERGQRVWVMGHIPPGVDPYTTVTRFRDVCGSEGPAMFLSSDRLTDLLVEYADVVRLAIFAHTHMDEVRLLSSGTKPGHSVAVKLVPSISPVDGNNPAFTVARVDAADAVLKDYTVIAASNQTGVGTSWSTEYNYAETYHQPAFSPQAVQKLVTGFQSDGHAQAEASTAYIRNYFTGAAVPEIRPFWPQYACSLANATAKTYAACVCSGAK